MPKRTIRQWILARRLGLPREETVAASLAVQKRFMATREFSEAKVIAIYSPIHNEVETGEIMNRVLESPRVLLFPKVERDGLELRRVNGPWDLQKGAFGIREPTMECALHAATDVDLFVVPGVAFDVKGRRIGYGKGYYDRTLHPLEGKGKLVGFCYDFQLVDEIALDPHDVIMDMVITERRVIRAGN
jgi:5-formyltetrahydrofolate cyclo-ligase